jgi:hypothetical protein
MNEILRTYVQKGGTVSSVCPQCGASHLLTIDDKKTVAGAIPVQCSCGKNYSFPAEWRKAYRRAVNLAGICGKTSSKDEQGEILIKNISMTGIGFFPVGRHSLKQGDQVLLQFVLTDANKTGMEVVAVVVRVSETMIGCSFQSLSPEQDDALASFFMTIV